jgi:hypothetical protein
MQNYHEPKHRARNFIAAVQIVALQRLLPLFAANKLDPLIKELNKGLKDGVRLPSSV